MAGVKAWRPTYLVQRFEDGEWQKVCRTTDPVRVRTEYKKLLKHYDPDGIWVLRVWRDQKKKTLWDK